MDSANYDNKNKGNILNILKNLKKEKLIIQYYDLRDTVIFNIGFIRGTGIKIY